MPITSTTWSCDNPTCTATDSGSAKDPPSGWRDVRVMAMYLEPGQCGVLCPDCVAPIAAALPQRADAPGETD